MMLRRTVVLLLSASASSWRAAAPARPRCDTIMRAEAPAQPFALSRRGALAALAVIAARPPLAARAVQDAKDLSRLKSGLKDIEFLLDNWARETTDPNSGNADPDKVRLYLGLRTTTSPLFQIDKLLANAGDKVADDDFEAWVEATENFNSQIAKVNELAYTANFGEYNPGGGKDQARPIPKRCRVTVASTTPPLASTPCFRNYAAGGEVHGPIEGAGDRLARLAQEDHRAAQDITELRALLGHVRKVTRGRAQRRTCLEPERR